MKTYEFKYSLLQYIKTKIKISWQKQKELQ